MTKKEVAIIASDILDPNKVRSQAKLLNVEKTLSHLLKCDLTFKGEKTNYATHNLHAFAAKFPPQLPKLFINELTLPKEYVLDPMSGSGTTLIEAIIANRIGIVVDLDPLATLLAKVKSTPLDVVRVIQVGDAVLREAEKRSCHIGNDKLSQFYSSQAVEFFRYWFEEKTVDELFALIQAILKVEEPDIQSFLKIVFSSCIITKSGGLTRARDLAHSRPHRDLTKEIRQNTFDVFRARINSAIELLKGIAEASCPGLVVRADTRRLPLPSGSVHLIVTSPPYAANAIDYIRAHKFSLMWFGFDPKELSALRGIYIGSELRPESLDIPSKTGWRIIQELEKKEKGRAAVVAHYFREMELSLREMLRVLTEGRAAILVVGSSVIKGVDIKAPTVLAEIAEVVGFRMVGITKRNIVRDSRMMPVSHKSERNGIEARMHEEGVIGLVKPYRGDTDADPRRDNGIREKDS